MSSLVHLGLAAAARAELINRSDTAASGDREPASPVPAHRRRAAADVMTRHPATVHQSASMWTAWDRLHAGRTGHLVVVDDRRRPVGVLDERTIALEWPPGPLGAHRAPVHTLLRDRLRPRVHSADDLVSVARIMLGAEVDAVPVVDQDGRLDGLITLRHYVELAADAGVPERTVRSRPPIAVGSRSGDTGQGGNPDRGARGDHRR